MVRLQELAQALPLLLLLARPCLLVLLIGRHQPLLHQAS